ncbi:hypothetical protein BAUCODRAFT_52707, partial [Baudoinia panamericana UAMH 10762]
CTVYGVDFQDGGSYFIDSGLSVNFTLATQFVECDNDTAYVLLVNESTGDEYECSRLPTNPQHVSQISTCPISKSRITSGNWSILTLGDNGYGAPFAYERDFYLTAYLPQITTVTDVVTFTRTDQSTATVT